jgi:dTDP-4-dehydrorhamnose reductase
MSRILLFGGTGMLATALIPVLSERGHEVTPLGLEDVELLDPSSAWRVVRKKRPDAVINAAAYTDVDGCEFAADLAMAVNGAAAGRIAEAAAELGCPLIHISTDYVFDGLGEAAYREDTPPSPRSRYGKSKLAGEKAVMAAGGTWTILRTAWLFGPGGNSFPRTIYRMARGGAELKVVVDQTGSPTYTFDLSSAVAQCLDRRTQGLYHVTNAGFATWHDVAVEVLRQAGIQSGVAKVTTGAFPRPAPRPRYSVLSNEKILRDAGVALPDWRTAIGRFVHDYLLKEAV